VTNRADAESIVEKLKQHPRISGVELFGSVLRKGRGHDIDFVVLVDREIARQWWSDMRIHLLVRMGTSLQPLRRFIKTVLPWLDEMSIRNRKAHRLAYASKLVGVDFSAIGQGINLDIFLMPEDWRTGTSLNVEALKDFGVLNHRNTRMFLESIARQAVGM